ncbi:MAG: hypothetical protein GQ534_00615 [Candidatus Delongbacteria bacterium]|nr:hypothetical protein [Candidatus Delongbacteria bacterium]
MKVILCTGGTHGDLYPFLDLGEALQMQGAEVLFILTPYDEEKGKSRGFNVVTSGPLLNVDEYIRDHPEIATIGGGRKIWTDGYLPGVLPLYNKTIEMIGSFKPDVVVSHTFCIGSQWAALDSKVKHVMMCLQPLGLFSVSEPLIMSLSDPAKFSDNAFLRWPISLLTRLKLSILYAYLNQGLKKVTRQLGIPYQGHSFNNMYDRADRILGLWSKEFRNRSEGDPDNLRICGFPFSPKDNDSQLSPAIKQFLSIHSSPVVVALGTSARNIALEIYEKIAQACENLGQPCILIGCDEKSIETRYKNTIVTPFESYNKLFPSASLIIHHGGMGTCAEVFYSGHSNIVIPFMADQFDNAFLANKLGVAPKALNRSGLSVQKLEGVISESLGNKERQEKALQLSEVLKRSGNGAVVAADEIKKLMDNT